jgi:hypothetical protein
MVCYIGSHNLSWDKIREEGLEGTVIVPMAVAAMNTSVLKTDLNELSKVVENVNTRLSITPDELREITERVKTGYQEMSQLFDLSSKGNTMIFDGLITAAESFSEVAQA